MKSEITGGVEEADAGGDVVSGEVAGENWKGASHVWRSPGRSTAWGVRLARGPAGYRLPSTGHTNTRLSFRHSANGRRRRRLRLTDGFDPGQL